MDEVEEKNSDSSEILKGEQSMEEVVIEKDNKNCDAEVLDMEEKDISDNSKILKGEQNLDLCIVEEVVIEKEVEKSSEVKCLADEDVTEVNSNGIDTAWEIDDVGDESIAEEETALVPEHNLSSVSVSYPKYKSAFTGYLTEKEYSIETGKHVKNDCTPKRSCFNCLGDHNIQECKKKKDFHAIARNKKSIMGKKIYSSRYHEVVENKHINCKPGEISEKLRAALGLNDDEAPDFIYRMRVLGYSPGWLIEAEAKRANVSLFDGTGKAMSHPDEEEGETDVSQVKYHPEKFISFPGFNIPFPEHIRDQCRELNYPTMQECHSRENFLKFMKMNKANKYKRKKLKAGDTPQSKKPAPKTGGDMDVDDNPQENSILEFNPPLPSEIVKPPEPPPLPPAEKEDGELSEDSNHSSPAKGVPPESESAAKKTPSASKKRSVDDSESSNSNFPPDDDDSLLSTTPKTKRHHCSDSKGFMMGVSIPDSITPFKTLPGPSKWSVDVSDHILFVNLPDALGTWKKMKGLVHNVQSVMTKLHDEEDGEEEEDDDDYNEGEKKQTN